MHKFTNDIWVENKRFYILYFEKEFLRRRKYQNVRDFVQNIEIQCVCSKHKICSECDFRFNLFAKDIVKDIVKCLLFGQDGFVKDTAPKTRLPLKEWLLFLVVALKRPDLFRCFQIALSNFAVEKEKKKPHATDFIS